MERDVPSRETLVDIRRQVLVGSGDDETLVNVETSGDLEKNTTQIATCFMNEFDRKANDRKIAFAVGDRLNQDYDGVTMANVRTGMEVFEEILNDLETDEELAAKLAKLKLSPSGVTVTVNPPRKGPGKEDESDGDQDKGPGGASGSGDGQPPGGSSGSGSGKPKFSGPTGDETKPGGKKEDQPGAGGPNAGHEEKKPGAKLGEDAEDDEKSVDLTTQIPETAVGEDEDKIRCRSMEVGCPSM